MLLGSLGLGITIILIFMDNVWLRRTWQRKGVEDKSDQSAHGYVYSSIGRRGVYASGGTPSQGTAKTYLWVRIILSLILLVWCIYRIEFSGQPDDFQEYAATGRIKTSHCGSGQNQPV